MTNNKQAAVNASALAAGKLLLTEREAAGRLNVSPRTLFAMRRAGKIPFVRMGTNLIRYSPDDLVRWITENLTCGVTADGQPE